MIKTHFIISILFCLFINFNSAIANSDSTHTDSVKSLKGDSINVSILDNINLKLQEAEKQRIDDSIKQANLELQLSKLKTTDNIKKEELLAQLKAIEDKKIELLNKKKSQIDSLRNTAKGYPVIGVLNDTLFHIYSRIGAYTAKERAKNISKKVSNLYDNDFLKVDSIIYINTDDECDIVYEDKIIMSVTQNDAIWYNTPSEQLARSFTEKIRFAIQKAKKENSLLRLGSRIGLAILVVILAWLVIFFIQKGNKSLLVYISKNKERFLKGLSYKDYTFLSSAQELKIIVFLTKIMRWFIYLIILYISLPVIFSIFPFSRTWADSLFQLIWTPFKGVLTAIWSYLPNLFSIAVIYIVMKYVNRFVKYFFEEIKSERLKLNGFHPDWAMPTYSIVRFLLYAFMFVLIFPYLPGSDSNVFKGVSVFLGVLFSLGSSSAIANMVAGLVITYMRPFKIGDRIKIGDVSGDVIEKTLLVTRIKTIKNEIVTIPNSSVLTGNTINYTIEAENQGLIVHTTVTIGYDVAWKDVHQALIDAALKTELISSEPDPFVLQTSLDDFYISYQVNAYTKYASKQAVIYSNMHQNIQDICNERGIEIMSPHYRAERDGNKKAMPDQYFPKNETEK